MEKITLNLREMMDQKGYKPYMKWLTAFGIGRNSARQILYGEVKVLKLSDLLKLCLNLNCTPRELLRVHIPEGQLPLGHPLWEWTKTVIPQPLDELGSMTPAEIAELVKIMKELRKGD